MIKNSTQHIILAVSLLTISSSVISKEISYDYVQGAYVSTSVDIENTSSDLDGDGFDVSGSFSVTPNIAITAGYGQIDFDTFLGIDTETTSFDLGVTAHSETLAPGASLFFNFSVVRGEVEVTDGITTIDDSDTGYEVSVGVRTMVTDMFEIDTGFSRVDVFDDNETTFGFTGRLHASESLSFGIGYVLSSDAEGYTVDARFGF